MLREVVAAPGEGAAGAADVLGAAVPLAVIAHGGATLDSAPGSVLSSLAHPARTNMTPVSGAITIRRVKIRIFRR